MDEIRGIATQKREILMTALEVIAGLWGDGEERVESLTYTFGEWEAQEIQYAVNRLMGAFNQKKVFD